MRQVTTDANGIYSGVTERTQTALTTLRSIVERLSQTTTPKTIVYISRGASPRAPGRRHLAGARRRARTGDDLRASTRGVRLGRVDGP